MTEQRIVIFDVIGCANCQADEEGNLLIGQAANTSQIEGLRHCPSCRKRLLTDDVIAVGINLRSRCGQGINNDAA